MAEINTEKDIETNHHMDEHKTYMDRILTVPNGGNGNNDWAALMFANPFMYLVLLGMMNNGLFGGGNGNNNQLATIQAQMNDNNNNQIAREAIQGNAFAISQLAQNLNVDFNQMSQAISSVNFALAQLGNQLGMSTGAITNSIATGNLTLIQNLKDMGFGIQQSLCQVNQQILNQGYQNQIQTINQTNDLQTTMRIENGLTRTEVAAFRQAWENSRYQDVVAEKTRLQTELDLLRADKSTTTAIQASIAPLQALLNTLSAAVLYNAKPYAVTQTAQQSGQ